MQYQSIKRPFFQASSSAGFKCANVFILVFLLINTSDTRTINSTSVEDGLAACFESPDAVPIECRVVNVKVAQCMGSKIISIPQLDEKEDKGEINCTSSKPIDMVFDGFQLADYVNTSFVRNAAQVFNEATFVFSISFSLSHIASPREVIVSIYGRPDLKMSFFLFRPGKDLFSANLMPQNIGGADMSLLKAFPVDYLDADVVIPCLPSNPERSLILKRFEPASNAEALDAPFDKTKGFILKTNPTMTQNQPTGKYICTGESSGDGSNDRNSSVLFEVKSKPDVLFQPHEEEVILFADSELNIACYSSDAQVILEGHFRSKPIKPVPISLSYTSVFKSASGYMETSVKIGDSGEIKCVKRDALGSNDNAVLKTWRIKTLNIRENPTLQLTKAGESQVVCQSEQYSVEQMELQFVFCQGVTECKLNEFCFDKEKGKNCPHIAKARPCKNIESQKTVSTLCLSLPMNDSTRSQGMIRCSAGSHSYQANYFRGFDNKIYLNWEEAPVSALMDIFVYNQTMYPHNSYPFGCRTSKFISDGKLQWVIRGKDGSEILLHKDRVKDLYGVYASDLDYKLYTVRESNIRLIYPNDYDILCLAPSWNATASLRYFKRINVAAKEAPVAAIVSSATVIILILIGVVVYVMWRLKKAKDAIRNLTEKEVIEFLEGNPDALKNAEEKDAHEMVDALPYDKTFEIPREKLLIDTENCLGKGAFGTVLKGRVEGISNVVAVKTVNSDCEVNRFKGFLSELKIMIYIGKHPNIVSLIGASTEKIKEKTLYIVVEFCANGSLESHLRKHKGFFVDQVVDSEITPGSTNYENFSDSSSSQDRIIITTIDLLRWSYQIARGMEYLATKKVVHADLAARNVLIDANGNAKITDFGLSRQLFDYTQYVKKQQEPLPWRWMAIESLQQLRFSTQSDVWAFGILLWEIFTVGDMPYPGLNWDVSFVQELCNGLRLIQPPYCTTGIYHIMVNCWQENPESRPSFSFIAQYFQSLLETLDAELETTKSMSIAYSNAPLPGYLRITELSREGSTKSNNVYVNS